LRIAKVKQTTTNGIDSTCAGRAAAGRPLRDEAHPRRRGGGRRRAGPAGAHPGRRGCGSSWPAPWPWSSRSRGCSAST
ncbi:MAG: hypothetical protein MZV65_39865, partial [Chromatiales bacterium]|nr:hypothetical protein [Chromatiales bacterium]